MRLNANVGAAVASVLLLGAAWSYAESPETRAAWRESEVAGKSGVTQAVWNWITEPRREVELHTSWVPFATNDTIPAFPASDDGTLGAAEGWGAVALSKASANDCRSKPKKVHKVTTTVGTAGTAGTFDSVMNQTSDSNYDIIIFTTGGVHTGTPDSIKAHCVYLAGQSAPGDGWVFQSNRGIGALNNEDNQDVVVRGITFNGDNNDVDGTQLVQVASSGNGSTPPTRYTVYDHISTHFQRDKWLIGNYNNQDTTSFDHTMQWNLLAFDVQGPGLNWTVGEGDYPIKRVSGHRNMLVELAHRMPNISICWECELTENLIYNWSGRALAFWDGNDILDSQSKFDFIANYYRPGPHTIANGGKGKVIAVARDTGCSSCPFDREVQLFASKNISDSVSMDSTANQRNLCQYVGNERSGICADTIFKGTTRLTSPQLFPVVRRFQSGALKDSIINRVGNAFRVSCKGDVVWDRRDALSDSAVARFLNSTGRNDTLPRLAPVEEIISTGLPTYAAGTACSFGGSGDNFVLPDSFEVEHFGSAQASEDTSRAFADPDNDGYLTIEEWLNGTDPVGGGGEVGVAPTYRASADTVWVRRMAASLQPPYAGAPDSYPIPTDRTDIPDDVTGQWIANTGTVDRVLHFTCDSTTDGAAVLDSPAFRDTATAMGLDPDALLARKPAGCN